MADGHMMRKSQMKEGEVEGRSGKELSMHNHD